MMAESRALIYMCQTEEAKGKKGKLSVKNAGSVCTIEIEDGEVRHKITEIIGSQNGLGVVALV